MTENPYSPPLTEQADGPRRSFACAFMFWLSAILGVIVVGLAVVLAAQNTQVALQNNGSLPPYVVAVAILILASGFGLFYSAWRWRQQRVRDGLVSFLLVAVAIFGGPWLLLWLLW